MIHPIGPVILDALRLLVSRLRRWMERAEQRRILQEMDDYQLRDIGLARDEASAEARRPFWHGDDPRTVQRNTRPGCERQRLIPRTRA